MTHPPSPEGPAIGLTDTFAELTDALAPGGRLVRSWPLKGGVSAEVHALELCHADGRTERVVVRGGGAGWKLSAGLELQYELLARLHAAGLPVPEPRWLDTDGVLATPALVMAFVPGTTEPPPDAVVQMAELLGRVHAVDLDALGLDGLERRVDPVPELLEWLDEATVARLRLGDHVHRPAGHGLLHGDFWVGNLLWDEGRLVGLVDWEDAAVGDPLSDLAGARIELLWRDGPAAMAAFTEAYQARHPLELQRLPVWELYVGTAADRSMHRWGLPKDLEARMRRRTADYLADAERRLTGGA